MTVNIFKSISPQFNHTILSINQDCHLSFVIVILDSDFHDFMVCGSSPGVLMLNLIISSLHLQVPCVTKDNETVRVQLALMMQSETFAKMWEVGWRCLVYYNVYLVLSLPITTAEPEDVGGDQREAGRVHFSHGDRVNAHLQEGRAVDGAARGWVVFEWSKVRFLSER